MAYKNYIFQYNQNRKGKIENNEKNSDILNWTNESTPIKSTNIKTDNSSNEVNSKTTKPIITTKVVENDKCSNNAVYIDGDYYYKNSYVSPGSCVYLNEIYGKCYCSGCDETNYLTDENFINDYINKPSSMNAQMDLNIKMNYVMVL